MARVQALQRTCAASLLHQQCHFRRARHMSYPTTVFNSFSTVSEEMSEVKHSPQNPIHRNNASAVDWSQRKKMLRIVRFKRSQRLGSRKSKTNTFASESIDDSDDDDDDMFGVDSSRQTGDSGDADTATEYTLRPALFTKHLKRTEHPRKLMEMWLRDRFKCRVDHINLAAAIVHFAQLSLKTIQPSDIHSKGLSWGVNRLVRDIIDGPYRDFNTRHIANVMWALGILAHPFEPTESHRDLRRCAAKLVDSFDSNPSIRRSAHLQNTIDILWAMHRLGLTNHRYYRWLAKHYKAMDIDIGVTCDGLSQMALIFAKRYTTYKLKGSEKDELNVDFWLKLISEFSDDFVLVEAEPHHIANILWSIATVQPKITEMSEKQIDILTKATLKLLDNLETNMSHCDGQTISIIAWCFTHANYPIFKTLRSETPLFRDRKASILTRLTELLSARSVESYVATNANDNIRPMVLSLNDAIVILQSITDFSFSIPNHICRSLMERIYEQMQYATQFDIETVISVMQSAHLLKIGDETMYEMLSKRLLTVMRDVGKRQWRAKNFLALFSVIQSHPILYNNGSLIREVVSTLQPRKQGWTTLMLKQLKTELAAVQSYHADNPQIHQQINDMIERIDVKLS